MNTETLTWSSAQGTRRSLDGRLVILDLSHFTGDMVFTTIHICSGSCSASLVHHTYGSMITYRVIGYLTHHHAIPDNIVSHQETNTIAWGSFFKGLHLRLTGSFSKLSDATIRPTTTPPWKYVSALWNFLKFLSFSYSNHFPCS